MATATYGTGFYGAVGGTYADLDGDTPPPIPDNGFGGSSRRRRNVLPPLPRSVRPEFEIRFGSVRIELEQLSVTVAGHATLNSVAKHGGAVIHFAADLKVAATGRTARTGTASVLTGAPTDADIEELILLGVL